MIIRVLDFCALRGIKLDYVERSGMHCSIPEAVYEITESLFFRGIPGETDTLQKNLSNVLAEVIALAESRNVDITTFVKLKMEYNKTRERLHGRMY